MQEKPAIYSPIDGGDGWHVVLRAYAFSEQSISDLPGKHRGIVPFVVGNRIDYRWRCHLGFRAAYDSGFETTSLIIPANDSELALKAR